VNRRGCFRALHGSLAGLDKFWFPDHLNGTILFQHPCCHIVSKYAFSCDLFNLLVFFCVEFISDVEESVKQIPLSPNGMFWWLAEGTFSLSWALNHSESQISPTFTEFCLCQRQGKGTACRKICTGTCWSQTWNLWYQSPLLQPDHEVHVSTCKLPILVPENWHQTRFVKVWWL
jgi:hypothetical protein